MVEFKAQKLGMVAFKSSKEAQKYGVVSFLSFFFSSKLSC